MRTIEIARSRGLRRGSRIIMRCGCPYIVGRIRQFHQRTCEVRVAARQRFDATRWWKRKKFTPNRRRAYGQYFAAITLARPAQLQPPPRPTYRCVRCKVEWQGRRYSKVKPKFCINGHKDFEHQLKPRPNRKHESKGLWKKRGRAKPGRVPQEVIDRVRALYAQPNPPGHKSKRKYWSLWRIAIEVGWSGTTVSRILKGQTTPARLCICKKCGNRWYTQLPPPQLPKTCPAEKGSSGCHSPHWNRPRVSKKEWARRISVGQKRVIRQRIKAGLPPRKTDPWRGVTPEQRRAWLEKGREVRRAKRARRLAGERVPYARELRARRLQGHAPSRRLQREGLQPKAAEVEAMPLPPTPDVGTYTIEPPTITVVEAQLRPAASVHELALRLSGAPQPRRQLPPHPDNPRCACRPCREARGLPPISVAPIGGA